jgi:hypothetical protein
MRRRARSREDHRPHAGRAIRRREPGRRRDCCRHRPDPDGRVAARPTHARAEDVRRDRVAVHVRRGSRSRVSARVDRTEPRSADRDGRVVGGRVAGRTDGSVAAAARSRAQPRTAGDVAAAHRADLVRARRPDRTTPPLCRLRARHPLTGCDLFARRRRGRVERARVARLARGRRLAASHPEAAGSGRPRRVRARLCRRATPLRRR